MLYLVLRWIFTFFWVSTFNSSTQFNQQKLWKWARLGSAAISSCSTKASTQFLVFFNNLRRRSLVQFLHFILLPSLFVNVSCGAEGVADVLHLLYLFIFEKKCIFYEFHTHKKRKWNFQENWKNPGEQFMSLVICCCTFSSHTDVWWETTTFTFTCSCCCSPEAPVFDLIVQQQLQYTSHKCYLCVCYVFLWFSFHLLRNNSSMNSPGQRGVVSVLEDLTAVIEPLLVFLIGRHTHRSVFFQRPTGLVTWVTTPGCWAT